MKKYVKKVYLSIMLIVFSLITMVATTYAWVGLLTNSTFDEFTINLQQNDDDASEYGIELSLDGINFSDNIDSVTLRRQLLKNVGYANIDRYTDNQINELFRKHSLGLCTTTSAGDSLNPFVDMNNEITNNYYAFDIYISIYKIGEQTTEDSTKNLDLYLRDYILTATTPTNDSGVYSYKIVNPVTFPTLPGSYLGNPILSNSNVINSIPAGSTISGVVSSNIANTCRVALEKFISVRKKHPEDYEGHYSRKSVYIYQTGSVYPTYDSQSGIYDFGSILPREYNFARLYYNSIHSEKPIDTYFNDSLYNEILNRGDVTYADDGVVNHIVYGGNGSNTDKVTTKDMIKFRIYFWYEGWDPDCFEVVNRKTVTLNLSFSTKNPNEGN